MASNHPDSKDWCTHIDSHVFLGKMCCLSGNFMPYNNLIAASVEGGADYAAALDQHMPFRGASITIKIFSIQCVQAAQASFNRFAGSLTHLQLEGVEPPNWGQMIDEACTSAKEKASKAINVAAGRAKAFISSLPLDTRIPATKLFLDGLKAAMGFLSMMWGKIKEVVDSLPKFLSGFWVPLTQAVGEVIAAALGTINFIKGGTDDFSNMVPAQVVFNHLLIKPWFYDVVAEGGLW